MYRTSPSPPGTCPRCRETLLAVTRLPGKIAVERLPGVRWCEKCGGVLADGAASQRIITTLDRDLIEIGFQAGRGRARKDDDGRPLSCPECQIEMVRTRIESACCVVDACPSHGTWFDAGELESVTRAFAHARRAGVLVRRAAPNPDGFAAAPTDPVAARAPAAPVAPDFPPSPLTSLVDFVRSLLDS